MTKISGKTVLITGGAAGIGKLMGAVCLNKGASKLIIWDVNDATLNETTKEFTDRGFDVSPYKVDVSSLVQIQETAAQILADGAVDILINNAGIVTGKPFHQQHASAITKTLAINVEGVWYSLLAKAGTFNASHCVEHLDPAILSKNILEPILGIQDIRIDKRIGFMDGKKGLTGLSAAVDSGLYAVAFALKPITFTQLKAVADQGEIMPPKSTYIEPKLRSGLTIYTIDDDKN